MANGSGDSWQREPVIVEVEDNRGAGETYGFAGSRSAIMVEGQLLRPKNRSAETLYVFIHPTSTLQLMPVPSGLATAGLHVFCAATRYAKNDSALIMEKAAIDLGAYVRYARAELGYRRVVLVGWSGGGSLALFYQAQSLRPTIRQTPAGDQCDLAAAKLQSADGILLIAAHLSRAETLTQWLDPSVIDERNPDIRDRALDLYSQDCRVQAPYTADFVSRFREGQIARNQRITRWVQAMLETLKGRNDGEHERAFVTHRTMCDPRWLDPSLEPNGRQPGWCYLGDPRAVNVGPIGLARFSTLRSWLSQWSLEHSNVIGARNAAGVLDTPVLQIVNGADDAVPVSHHDIIFDALGSQDKEQFTIDGAGHYYAGQPDLLRSCVTRVVDWSRAHDFG